MNIVKFIRKYFPTLVIEGYEVYRTLDDDKYYKVKCEGNIIINVGEEDLIEASSNPFYVF